MRVIGEFLVRPYEAFQSYKGRYLSLSVVLGVLLNSPLLFGMVWLMDDLPQALTLIMLIAVANVVVTVALLHIVSLMLGGEGTWQELLSVFGFTVLPNLVLTIATVTWLSLGLLQLRNQAVPGVFSAAGRALIAYFFFELAMKLAMYIYSGLAISTVYKLKWTRVVACIVVSFAVGSFVGGLSMGLMPFHNLSWKALPLMLDGVEAINVELSPNTTVALKSPEFVRGETVLVMPGATVYLNSVQAANLRYNDQLLAQIAGLPGDRVELRSGNLLVNGELKQASPRPLQHLSMKETTLADGQFFVYFTSPALLGTETKPEGLIIKREQVTSAVSRNTLTFLRWLAR